MCELNGAPTEERNLRTVDIDTQPTLELVRMISHEDHRVPAAVAATLSLIAVAVDYAVEAMRAGGRLHYFGAGTSGRLAVIDAAELPPTYGIEPGRVVAHHAGGRDALLQAVEEVEDDMELGARDAAEVRAVDFAIGISASGRTPYVISALREAARRGAHTALISSNPASPYGSEVDVHIGVDTGPEVIMGSTRMKAGTAAKVVLNSISTATMIRLGLTYSNLMVGVNATNTKLRARLVRMLMAATGMGRTGCERALAEAGGDTRVALVSLLGEVPPQVAAAALRESDGSVREALRVLLPADVRAVRNVPNVPNVEIDAAIDAAE
ncbi:MAG TPA: N-acetylmuramic acid 6-phosphate etherase [Streptosporangiaceae bacterium]|nr:N-acetylmuramic acid 6-phosphate etherase [Streptosporangiaceae bacterium]